MRRALAWLGGALLAVFAALLALAWTPDLSREELVARYAGPDSRFLSLPSGAVAHYRMRGPASGPVLVLLHGSNASLHTWEAWVLELSSDYRVVTVDLPGHGLTGPTPVGDYTYSGMIQFVKEFTQAIDIDYFILGGNSMGGGVTLSYALAHPEDLAGIVLVDSGGLDLPFGEGSRADLPLAFRLAGTWYAGWAVTRVTPRSLVAEGLRKSFSDSTVVTEAMVERYRDLVRYPGNREATGKRFMWYRDGRKPLPVERLSVPALVLWGAQDRLIPLAVGEEMHRRIAGSELVVLPGIGHIPQEESAAASAAAVRDFIGRRVQGAQE